MSANILSPITFSKGQPIFDAGEKALFAFIVLNGKVEVTIQGEEVKTQSIAKGQFFGEETLSNELVYHNSARALIDTKCIRLGKEALNNKLDQADPFLRAMFKIFASHQSSIMKVGQAARAREDIARLAKDMNFEDNLSQNDDDQDSFHI